MTFVGRRQESEHIRELLRRARLLTLTGIGGCGKTRLALAVASDEKDRYPDGVWWVDVGQINDPALLATTAINAVGFREAPARAPADALIEQFRERRLLLILDNCEHLVAACAEFVLLLLRSCASLAVLATSRAPLGVPGETSWPVPPMSLPPDATAPSEELEQFDAVRLFVERAMRMRPTFAHSPSNAPAIVQICRELDGIPLAIELAAARVGVLSVEQIARGLADRFHLLTGGSRMVTARYQTLQASLDWSHALLGDGERSLFQRLSVFAGGWTLLAAEQVCAGGGIEPDRVLDLLTVLVDNSLISADEQGAEMRFSMLKTVRHYAARLLAESGEAERLRDRHLAYYLSLAEQSEAGVVGAGRDDPAFGRLAAEAPNFRAALAWATERDPEAALTLAASLTLFCLFTGRYREADAAYEAALGAANERPTPLRGRVLWGRAIVGLYGGAAGAEEWARAALEIGNGCGDAGLQARAYAVLGRKMVLTDPSGSQQLFERSVDLASESGDEWCRIDAAQMLGWSWNFRDEFERGRPYFDDAYEGAARLGYRWGAAWHWLSRGREALQQGRLDDATGLLARAVQASDEVGEPVTHVFSKACIAMIHVMRGETERALLLARETVVRIRESGAAMAFGHANDALARAELAVGDFAAAREHLERAIATERYGLAFYLAEQLSVLGTLERLEGNLEAGEARGNEALHVATRVGSVWLQSQAERVLARVALARGDAATAEARLHQALGHLSTKGFALYVPECLDALATAVAARGALNHAARLLGAASGGRESLGVVRWPAEPAFWSNVEETVREALGDDAYGRRLAEGASLSLEKSVAYARRARGPRRHPSQGWDALTPTELQVAELASQGLTNPQIGARMFISRATAKTHLSHIFAKLGITSRSELAAEAGRRGLGDLNSRTTVR